MDVNKYFDELYVVYEGGNVVGEFDISEPEKAYEFAKKKHRKNEIVRKATFGFDASYVIISLCGKVSKRAEILSEALTLPATLAYWNTFCKNHDVVIMRRHKNGDDYVGGKVYLFDDLETFKNFEINNKDHWYTKHTNHKEAE